MAFSATIDKTGIFPVITLKDEGNICEAVVYSFGALLNAFSVVTAYGKTNVIDGFTSPQNAVENITNGFKSAKLSPFVCRMNDGKYSFHEADYTIDKFYLGSSAIHGLLFNAPFTVKNAGADEKNAFVTLEYIYSKKEEGFPFAFSMRVNYVLSSNNTLTLTTTVINTGESSMPLSDGWHPYFCLGNTVNNLQVTFNSKKIVEFNDQLIPSGKMLPYTEFNSFKVFGDTFLDNCFAADGTEIIHCTIKDTTSGLQLDILPDASYPYLQIYTPPHRKSIAIENLSSVPDAFNNGIGLIVAKPGEVCSFTTCYQLSLL